MLKITDQIAQADETELGELLKAVLKRYADVFPDWEVSTISVQKSEDRNEQLDRIIQMIEKMKDYP